MKNAAFYNGRVTTVEDMTVPLNDRAVYFGDGVYDVAFCHNGKPFLIDEHFDRFYNSCKLIKIDFQYSRDELRTIIEDLISRLDDKSDDIIYWQASRGTAARNHPFPGDDVRPNLLMYVKPKKITNLDKRMKLVTWEDIRYKMCNVKTINLIPNILAAEHAVSSGCDEAVQIRDMLVTENGEILRDAVTEGAHTNIFIVKDGKLITAPLGCYILPGIARKHVIELCREHGIETEERYITRSELFDADEILITSTTTLVRAACELDGRPVGCRDRKLVDDLQSWYLEKLENATK